MKFSNTQFNRSSSLILTCTFSTLDFKSCSKYLCTLYKCMGEGWGQIFNSKKMLSLIGLIITIRIVRFPYWYIFTIFFSLLLATFFKKLSVRHYFKLFDIFFQLTSKNFNGICYAHTLSCKGEKVKNQPILNCILQRKITKR